jgi:hypothetical protein
VEKRVENSMYTGPKGNCGTFQKVQVLCGLREEGTEGKGNSEAGT